MNKRIIISVTNDLSSDQRVHRTATTLHEAGASVILVGRKKPDSLPLQARDYACIRLHMWFSKGKLFYLEYNFRLFFYLLFHKFDLLNANDLDSLLANFLAASIKGKEIVYDSHEYFTEVPELQGRKLTRSIWLRLEKWIFPRLKKAITVNDSLARIYYEKYKVPVEVVRNLPIRSHYGKKREFPGNVIIYQGALNLGRGIELMIRSMRFLPGKELWLIGHGDLSGHLQELTRAEGLENQVVFKGFVAPEALRALTPKAALGFSLEEDLGQNYHFALPNKLFDYVQAGVPVLVSDLPEMAAMVKQHKVGEILPLTDRSPEKLAQRVIAVLKEPGKWVKYQENCLKAAEDLCWENEKKVLEKLY